MNLMAPGGSPGFHTCILIAMSAGSMLLAACDAMQTSRSDIRPETMQALKLEALKPIVEPITDIPDFAAIRNIPARKKAFFDFLRPVVVSENARVAGKRVRMLGLLSQLANGVTISEADAAWLTKLAGDYRIPMQSLQDKSTWESLQRRVDTVPYRLALAQAANETSWGTSRFAREGRNFFGQWCFSEGCGMIPTRRQEGMTHEVAVFASVNDSVASYLHHLNRTAIYKSLRQAREEKRRDGTQPTAIELAGGLTGYSAIGKAYVKAIRTLIRVNYDLMAGPSGSSSGKS